MKSYLALLAAGLLSLTAVGCDVDVVEDGKPADVDVIETDDAPAADGADVDVSSEKTEIDAPDVDVDAPAPADAPKAESAPGV
jgi:hypothetical protein